MKWLVTIAAAAARAVAVAGLASRATLNDRVDKLEEAQKPKLRLLALR
jgi:hypothetical protein